MYNKLADCCFENDPLKRGTFTDLVQLIEELLADDEKMAYKEMTEQYASMCNLISKQAPKFKNSITRDEKLKSQSSYFVIEKSCIDPYNEQIDLLATIDEESKIIQTEQVGKSTKNYKKAHNSIISLHDISSDNISLEGGHRFPGYKQV